MNEREKGKERELFWFVGEKGGWLGWDRLREWGGSPTALVVPNHLIIFSFQTISFLLLHLFLLPTNIYFFLLI